MLGCWWARARIVWMTIIGREGRAQRRARMGMGWTSVQRPWRPRLARTRAGRAAAATSAAGPCFGAHRIPECIQGGRSGWHTRSCVGAVPWRESELVMGFGGHARRRKVERARAGQTTSTALVRDALALVRRQRDGRHCGAGQVAFQSRKGAARIMGSCPGGPRTACASFLFPQLLESSRA